MSDFTPEEAGTYAGERIVFWVWMSIVTVGLVTMLTVALSEL